MSVLAYEPVEVRAEPAVDSSPRLVVRPWMIVLALTLLGGVLRFAFLDRPAIWGDDAMTFMRISGTYQQLLDSLQDWGFVPLHYELLWWIRQGMPITSTFKLVPGGINMTPTAMRFVPALLGTLMVPAMYWLAVQMVSRRAAIVVALFTATSAYLLNYSRDAKMYMHVWFFVTLSTATLLWWLRVRTLTSWLCWVAASCAMVGFHSPGAMVLGIQFLMVLTARHGNWLSLIYLPVGLTTWPVAFGWPKARALVARRKTIDIGPARFWLAKRWRAFRWPPMLQFLAGLAIIGVGPYLYYTGFNRYFDRIDKRGWGTTGIQWVEMYNRGRQAVDYVKYTSTAYLFSWEWPRKFDKPRIDDQADVHPRNLRLLKGASITMFGFLAIGVLPWPRRWRGDDPGRHPRAQPWWIGLLWISAWIVIPTYGTYCASVRNFQTPWNWYATARDAVVAHPVTSVGIGALVVLWMILALRRFVNVAIFLALVAALVGVCAIAARYIDTQDGSVWMPRYLGVIWPAFAIAVAVLLLRLPTRPLRLAAIGFLVAVNLAQYSARLFAGSEPPVDRMARDVLAAQPDDATIRTYYGIRQSFDGAPGWGVLQLMPGRYYLTVYSGRPTTPREMMTGLFGGQIWDKFKRWPRFAGALDSAVVGDVSRNPRLKTIIVWDRLEKWASDLNDKLGDQLETTGWRRTELTTYRARDHWTWRELYQVRRRAYVRGEIPATAPSTAPSTATTTAPSSQPGDAPSR